MTGNLDMLMMFRDLQVAQDVGRWNELGRYDKEFAVYGLVYGEGEKRRYVVTSDDGRLYDRACALLEAGYWLTPLESLSESVHVPAGCEEEIARAVKLKLAQRMAETYTLEFAHIVAPLAALAPTDAAAPALALLCGQMEGYYRRDALQLLGTLIELAWQSKVLSAASAQAMRVWLGRRLREMEDDVRRKDMFERTFYGLAYERDGCRQVLVNANRGALYGQKLRLTLAHCLTTPIVAKTYWYNYTYRLADVRRDFEQFLQWQLQQWYWQQVVMIKSLPAAIPREAYQRASAEAAVCSSPQASEALALLGLQWNII